jgi:hypothetical protein
VSSSTTAPRFSALEMAIKTHAHRVRSVIQGEASVVFYDRDTNTVLAIAPVAQVEAVERDLTDCGGV